jgi:organic hydroperoxide reductase OsmC/OhrA
MTISAVITNTILQNEILLSTNGNQKSIQLPIKTENRGVAVNGGELLFLALATCFCNDIYREAAKRKMEIISVDVIVSGEFGSEGEPARNISYRASIQAPAHSEEEIQLLIRETDKVAEIQNTIRQGVDVKLVIA